MVSSEGGDVGVVFEERAVCWARIEERAVVPGDVFGMWIAFGGTFCLDHWRG